MEDKMQKLLEFAISFKDDPDFNRLVFPAPVLAKLAEMGITQKKKEYSAQQAVDKCYAIPREERYNTNVVEVIDQTSLAIEFPKIPETVDSIDTTETKTPELVDSSNSPVLCDVSGSALSS
jgi:hypothetical protein